MIGLSLLRRSHTGLGHQKTSLTVRIVRRYGTDDLIDESHRYNLKISPPNEIVLNPKWDDS